MNVENMSDWELWDALLKAEVLAQNLRVEYTRRGLMKTPLCQWSRKPPAKK